MGHQLLYSIIADVFVRFLWLTVQPVVVLQRFVPLLLAHFLVLVQFVVHFALVAVLTALFARHQFAHALVFVVQYFFALKTVLIQMDRLALNFVDPVDHLSLIHI